MDDVALDYLAEAVFARCLSWAVISTLLSPLFCSAEASHHVQPPRKGSGASAAGGNAYISYLEFHFTFWDNFEIQKSSLFW